MYSPPYRPLHRDFRITPDMLEDCSSGAKRSKHWPAELGQICHLFVRCSEIAPDLLQGEVLEQFGSSDGVSVQGPVGRRVVFEKGSSILTQLPQSSPGVLFLQLREDRESAVMGPYQSQPQLLETAV